jgi:hypothetical protein
MTQTLDATTISWSVGATANAVTPPSFNRIVGALAYAKSQGYSTGAGASQMDRLFAAQRTITASGTDDLDLSGTALQDILGQNLALVRVKLIAVYAATGNTNNVVVGAAASNQFIGPFGAATHTLALPPGGSLLVVSPTAAGWAVTAGTGDLFRVANGGASTSVTYDVIIGGSST